MRILKNILISLVLLVIIGFIVYQQFFVANKKNVEPIFTPLPATEVLYRKYVNKYLGYEITLPPATGYEEKIDGKFVTVGNKITIYLLDSDPEKCSEECPIIDSKETVNINGQDAHFFKLHWEYDGVNTPQSFVNYVFSLKDKYLVFQLQEVDFNQDININRSIGKLSEQELDEFNNIVKSLTFIE